MTCPPTIIQTVKSVTFQIDSPSICWLIGCMVDRPNILNTGMLHFQCSYMTATDWFISARAYLVNLVSLGHDDTVSLDNDRVRVHATLK